MFPSEGSGVARVAAQSGRPDVWWFGVILLARGPLLSLPAVVATDMPALTLALMLGILLLAITLSLVDNSTSLCSNWEGHA